jgi:septal ring factor EnvC (AmiA/AmiB activator)
MPDVTLPEAAAALGVSIDTIRRRIKRGDLLARKDGAGRYVVTIDTDAAQAHAHDAAAAAAVAEQQSEADRLRLELAHARELVEELRRQRETLDTQLAAHRHQIEQDAIERAELRRLLGNAQQQLAHLLPAPMQGAPPEGAPGRERERDGDNHHRHEVHAPWWRFWRRQA